MTQADGAPFDLLIVGGGINGVGIARDAAGRGLKVMLCERFDLASATSSASTKMVHGGLRYLEHFAFRLVAESLAERETLLRLAPHLVTPLRLIMPHGSGQRPAWMVRFGLFLYDHIGGRRSLPDARGVDLRQETAGAALGEGFHRGFAFFDCWVDDARLVIANAMAAAELGATIATNTACLAARRDGSVWRVELGAHSGERREVTARVIVNAAGPWVRDLAVRCFGLAPTNQVRLVKGSHIVVPRLFAGEEAYLLQNDDGRVVFVIPYERDFTLIGTTETVLDVLPDVPRIEAAEVAYLCRAVGRYFRRAPDPAELVWSFSGIRPLYDDGESDPSAVTRDYVLDLDRGQGHDVAGDAAPILSVYGGKLTTYRRLAEKVLARLAPYLVDRRGAWTAATHLPGGDIGASFAEFRAELERRYPGIEAPLVGALARRHGGNATRVLGDARSMADLGQDFGGGLFAREVEWFVDKEWARNADDILWRRTKCGLKVSVAARERLTDWLAARRGN